MQNLSNFINAIFIDYCFVGKWEDSTETEERIKNIDDNRVNIKAKDLEKTQVYINAVLKTESSEDVKIKRLKIVLDKLVSLYNNQEIEFIKLFEFINSITYTARSMIYIQHYMKKINSINQESIREYNTKEKSNVDAILRGLEEQNIYQYDYAVRTLLAIISGSCIDDIEKFNGNTEIGEYCNSIKQYLKNEAFNQIKIEDIERVGLEKLLTGLIGIANGKEYKTIDLSILNTRIEEFIENQIYIEKLRNIKVVNKDVDFYVNLRENWDIKEEEVAGYIEKLSGEEDIDYVKMVCFQKLIRMLMNSESIENQTIANVEKIFKRIKPETISNEFAWFDIMIKVEKILKQKESA